MGRGRAGEVVSRRRLRQLVSDRGRPRGVGARDERAAMDRGPGAGRIVVGLQPGDDPNRLGPRRARTSPSMRASPDGGDRDGGVRSTSPPRTPTRRCRCRSRTSACSARASCSATQSGPGAWTSSAAARKLRDHYEGTFLEGPYFNAALPDFLTLCMHSHPSGFTWGNAASSAIFVLPPDGRPPYLWWAAATPCTSVYVPVFVDAGGVPAVLERDEPAGDSYWWTSSDCSTRSRETCSARRTPTATRWSATPGPARDGVARRAGRGARSGGRAAIEGRSRSRGRAARGVHAPVRRQRPRGRRRAARSVRGRRAGVLERGRGRSGRDVGGNRHFRLRRAW